MWKPGDVHPSSSSIVAEGLPDSIVLPSLDDEDTAISVVYNPKRHLPIDQQRRNLPIYVQRTQFLWGVETSRTTIVIGEPGSGKSTQLPQYLMEAGWCKNGMVIVVVPRRIAAVTLATRVAEEIGDTSKVGYSTSTASSLSSANCIRYVTDGILLRYIQNDPLLTDASVIIMDDCHERRVESDVCLGLLKKIQKKRKYLRVVVSSATVDTEVFVNFFRSQWMSDEVVSFKTDEKNNISAAVVPSSMRRSHWDLSTENKADDDSVKNTPISHVPSKELTPVSIISINKRPYPVKVKYLKEPCSDYIQTALATVLKIHCTVKDLYGILIFVCGKEEVETLVERIEESANVFDSRLGKLEVAPLYATLPPVSQIAAFRRPKPEHRKIIVSTNIAESSVTIDNIGYVIDCGFYKTTFFDANSRVSILSVVPISATSATQRAGRAGRTVPGTCYRLYTENALSRQLMPEFSIPEVLRSDFTHVLLYLLSLGIDNFVNQIELPTPISSAAVIEGLATLYALQAIDDDGKLTHPLGERMAELPLSPMFARFVLLAANEPYNCACEAVIIASMAYAGSPWTEPHRKSRLKNELREACMRSIGVIEGDLVTLYNVYKQTEFYQDEDSSWTKRHMINMNTIKTAERVKKQLESYFSDWNLPMDSCGGDVTTLCKTICAAFFLNACQRRRDGSYELCRSSRRNSSRFDEMQEIMASSIPPMMLHPLSITNPKQPLFIVFADAIAASTSSFKNGTTMLSQVTTIDPRWLQETAGHFYCLDLAPELSREAKL